MKTGAIVFPLITLVFIFSGCDPITKCKNISQREAVLLIDVSDPKLYTEIENDLGKHLPKFMAETGLATIDVCQKFSLSFAHLSGKDALELETENISINQKGQSNSAVEIQSSPAPLVKLVQKKLTEYKLLSEDPVMTSQSNIANTLFKSINYCNPKSDNVIILFSDLVENNRLVNFYKKIPGQDEVSSAIDKMIEPAVLQKFKSQSIKGRTKVIIVLKSESKGRVSVRDVRSFWEALFKELKFDANVQFIDNLSIPVEL
ncbi:hypothetical protein [Dyadobacter pollutisoli]|uniref:Uncharacterized protein n=1 Tax=Dyadobacter pollutisoli TaxID=2910158 RepID=A0A9E8N9E0_9BACT|nr:hypothetical protein [Dyadobacter pollutisoli]WAC12394.1 hypothetical protein ON006_00235 [Dyadobacter pollutisoli]